MSLFLHLLLILIRLYILVILLRITVEMIQSFSRNFRPPRWFMIMAEPLFMLTDPPIKGLRKVIPPVRVGGVALDLSIIVLFFALQVLMIVLSSLSF